MSVTETKPGARRSAFATLAFGFCLLGGVFVAGFVWFIASMPDAVENERTVTEAIVVLTGGSDRVTTGLTLLERGLGRRLFISGVGQGTPRADLLERAGRTPDAFACCLTLGRGADSTHGNARETAAWMRAEHLKTLRLVTAQYHMPRSLLVFRREMPDVTIVPHPVFPEAVKRDEWWQWPGTTRLLVTEYLKYLGAVAIGIAPVLERFDERHA